MGAQDQLYQHRAACGCDCNKVYLLSQRLLHRLYGPVHPARQRRADPLRHRAVKDHFTVSCQDPPSHGAEKLLLELKKHPGQAAVRRLTKPCKTVNPPYEISHKEDFVFCNDIA